MIVSVLHVLALVFFYWLISGPQLRFSHVCFGIDVYSAKLPMPSTFSALESDGRARSYGSKSLVSEEGLK